jgi:hypothetical protein
MFGIKIGRKGVRAKATEKNGVGEMQDVQVIVARIRTGA